MLYVFTPIVAPACREFGCTEHLEYLGFFKEEGKCEGRGEGAVPLEPLERRQSGKRAGVNILGVRGSVQGRF